MIFDQSLFQCESVMITLTPEEFEILLVAVSKYVTYSRSISAFRFLNKLEFVSPNPGDACRHSVQSSGVVGQGGTHNLCPSCNGLCIDPLDIAPCDDCQGTGIEPEYQTSVDHTDAGNCRCDHCYPY